jgi:hypothetical protein
MIFLMVHGVGHLAGFWWPSYSWLLTGRFGDPLVRAVTLGLWLVALIGFIAAGTGVLSLQTWWRPLAVAAAVVSLAVIVLLWDGSKLGAGLADVAILVALLWAHWPSAAVVGS